MIRGFLLLFSTALVAGAAVEQPSTPIILSPEAAAKEGCALAAEIFSQKPVQNFTNTGVVKIREATGKRTEVPVTFQVSVTDSNWQTVYFTRMPTKDYFGSLTVIHADNQPNHYRIPNVSRPPDDKNEFFDLAGNQTMTPFAFSDFWLADLGLEFLHWPTQRLLRKEIRRGQSCDVLESVNPQPAPGAYSRVVSWVDRDTDGIINAEAYDSKGKLLKEFAVTSLKKVRGQMELKGMEISNRQTRSRTTLEFDLAGEK